MSRLAKVLWFTCNYCAHHSHLKYRQIHQEFSGALELHLSTNGSQAKHAPAVRPFFAFKTNQSGYLPDACRFLPWNYLFEKIRKDPYAGIIRTLPILVVGSNFCCCWLSEILAVEIPQSWLSDSPTSRSLFKLWASSVARKRLPRWPWQARTQVHRTIPKWMVYNGKSMKIWMIWGYPVWLWKPPYWYLWLIFANPSPFSRGTKKKYPNIAKKPHLHY